VRVQGALADLGQRLRHSGQHLQTLDGHRYAILADADCVDDSAIRTAREHDLRSLSSTAAWLLNAAINGSRRSDG
jgi:hypothetical protein